MPVSCHTMGGLSMADVVGEISVNESGSFVVDGLVITDSDAVEFLKSLEADERLKAISTAVHFGLLALRDFGTVSKMDWIDKRFQSFETRVTTIFEEVRNQLDHFLGDRGELDRKFTESDGPIRSVLDPFTENSPLYNLRRELNNELQSIRELVSTERGRAEEAEFGTRKGLKFEDELFDFLEPICSKMGDTVKKIGTRKIAGRKVGDLLIEVNEKHLDGPLLLVIEAKSAATKLSGKEGLLSQLETALDLRKAQFALGVVKVSGGIRGVDGCYSHIPPNKIVCTYEPDGLAVEVAYRYARAEALLRAHGTKILDAPTCAAISMRIAEIVTKLNEFSNTKSHLTNIEKSTKSIRDAIRTLEVDIKGIVASVETLISKTNPPSSVSKTRID